MPKKINFRGQIHQFPDDFSAAQIQHALRSFSKEKARSRKRKLTIYALSTVIVALLVVAVLSVIGLRTDKGPPKTTNHLTMAKSEPMPHPEPVSDTRPPATTTFVLKSNLDLPVLSLDGHIQATPQNELRIPGTGDHKAVVTFPKTGETTITFHSAPDLVPEISQISAAPNLIVAIVSGFGHRVKVYGTPPYSTVKLNGKVKGKTAATGLLIDIPQEGGTLIVSSGKQERRVFVTALVEPRMQIIVSGEPDYASVVVLTPDVDDAIVFAGDQQLKSKTRKGRLTLSSLRPGTIALRVERENFCTVGADATQTLILKAGDQKEARFVLKRLPQLRIENAPEKAQFSLSPDPKLYPVSQPMPLQPGHYTVTVRAADFLPYQRAIDIACGQDTVPLQASMVRDPNYRDPKSVPPQPITETAQVPIQIEMPFADSESSSPPRCLKTTGEWQKAGSACFFSAGKAPGTYSFEVQGTTDVGKAVLTFGARIVLRYGPWLIGTPVSYVECQVEGDKFRWRKAGAVDWEEAGKFEQPVNASSLMVSFQVAAGSADVTMTPSDTGKHVTSKFAVPGEGFGLKRGTPIRGFHHSK